MLHHLVRSSVSGSSILSQSNFMGHNQWEYSNTKIIMNGQEQQHERCEPLFDAGKHKESPESYGTGHTSSRDFSERNFEKDTCHNPKEKEIYYTEETSAAPNVPLLDRSVKSSKQKEDDIASVISHIVDRVCEVSVASDVSGLTDADVFRTDDSYSSPNHMYASKIVGQSSTKVVSSKNNSFRSKVRAPEPPAVAGGMSKLTDIESETTSTTVSSTQDEKMGKRKKRSVSFCAVQVRNYERVLELNPSVTSGPALGIGWNYSPEEDEIFSLENFEDSREHSRRHSMKDLALPRWEREDILRSLGYTERQIAGSVRTIIRVKNQRKQTIHNLHVSSMEEFVEKATRKMKRVLLFQNRKKVKDVYSYPRPSTLATHGNLESSVLKKTSIHCSCPAA
mmetsp:Transcript_20201/g.56167  ORF Transcript_20201/g.56167 Transcript_20201/m.56167 type:complete len:394 (+) Transcript_20201:133-1314(+)